MILVNKFIDFLQKGGLDAHVGLHSAVPSLSVALIMSKRLSFVDKHDRWSRKSLIKGPRYSLFRFPQPFFIHFVRGDNTRVNRNVSLLALIKGFYHGTVNKCGLTHT